MQAAIFRNYGSPDVLKIEEIQKPLPKSGDVLVRVRASTVTAADVRVRASAKTGLFWLPLRLAFGVFRPRNPVPGMEFAGEIANLGPDVSRFRVGDAVFGMKIGGANAAYLTIPETGAIAVKPDNLTHSEAAAVPFGALSALVFLRDFALLKPAERVLVHGASGAVGAFAIQLAKHMGAHVTGVCSQANVELIKSLGADAVIDYTASDYTDGAERYDVILDTVGGTSFLRSRRVLVRNGRHVFMVHGMREILQALWTSVRRGKRVIVGFSGTTQADLAVITKLLEDGTIRPVIDRTYALREIVKAHAYVGTGRKRGAVVIAVADDMGEAARASHPSAAPVQGATVFSSTAVGSSIAKHRSEDVEPFSPLMLQPFAGL